MTKSRFPLYAWSVLAFNLLVILWGAFVRATGSGAGCGSHWPLCNGEVLPRTPALETIIELSHRASSGIALIAVCLLVFWALRLYPGRNRVKSAALASGALIIVEALIGAGLVLLELVATNISVARALWMAGHLVNTFFLIAALTLTAWWAAGGPAFRLRDQGRLSWLFGAGFLGTLILSSSGAITALGGTLLLHSNVSLDESPLLAQLVSLRIVHPLLALAVGLLLWILCRQVWVLAADRRVRRFVTTLGLLYGLQLFFGALNVQLKAPVWLQLLHLLLANGIWITLVLLASVALPQRIKQTPWVVAGALRPQRPTF